jgi:hypothetical protein
MAETRIVVISVEELAAVVHKAVTSALAAHAGGPALLDKPLLGKKLCCSVAHIDALRRRGLPVVYVGDLVRFDLSAVLAWLREQPE